MQSSVLSPTQFHHQATFQSRGVAAPYTAPFLAGARVRSAPHGGSELVLPNPSGSRGVYIVPWAGVGALCHPTVHDTILSKYIARLPRIDPVSIRNAALDVAIEGHAGRAAAAAAESARENDRSQRASAHVLIVSELLHQMDPSGPRDTLFIDRTQFERQAGTAIQRLGPLLGRPAAQLERGVLAIGDAFAPVGVARDAQTARIPRLIERLKQTWQSLATWLSDDPENDIGGLGQAIATALQAVGRASHAALAATRGVLAEPVALVKRWISNQDDVLALASRCDWLLDGWERVCLLWLVENSKPSRRGTLLEMAQLLPVLPSEVKGWNDPGIPHQALSQAYHVTSHNDSWRSGSAAFGLIHRNETIRAMSL